MKTTTFFKAASLLSSLVVSSVNAQQATYTHPGTGITFYKQTVTSAQTAGGYEWGYALPGAPDGTDDEYIGYMVSSKAGNYLADILTIPRKAPWRAEDKVTLESVIKVV
jgi:cellobiose dehydrogenase (acceptor)